MKKLFSLFAAVLFAGSMMAVPYKWDGRGVTSASAATEVGGKAAGIYFQTAKTPNNDDYNTNSNMIAGTGQKGNWVLKMNKGFKFTTTERYYIGVTLDEAVNAGDTIKVAAFRTTETSCVLGMDFSTDSASQSTSHQVTLADNLQIFESNGTPVDSIIIVPEGVANAKFIRVYRKSGSTGLYVAHLEVAPYVAPAPAEEWDGTVTLSQTSFSSIADLEGLQLTFNGATTIAFLGADADMIALQNEDGSDLYAVWHPEYGGSYTINGNVVTLSGWFDNTGAATLPETSATLYVEDYGSFRIDGEADYFETAEIAYEAPAATTYTVTYSVSGIVADETAAQAGYYNQEAEGAEFVAGANVVPENMIAYVYAQMIEGYTCEVLVNGAAVTLTDGYWEAAITADMTIAVAFSEEQGEVSPYASVYTSNVEFTAGTNSYLTDKINIDGTEYDAFKIGTSKAAGSCSVTLPAGTEAFYFHAICWSKTADTNLDITGAYTETVVIKAANISGNSPYTFDLTYADPTERFYSHTFDAPLAAEATVTFSCAYRAVFFGVNAVGAVVPTSLDNLDAAQVVKFVENGQVIILRDGVRYNALGQVIE